MPVTFGDYLRGLLGTDQLITKLNTMEDKVATAAEQIQSLSTRFDDFAADVRAALDTLTAERENLTPSGQAALDELSQKLDAADTSVGDADGSDAPPVEPTEPTEPPTF